MTRYLVTSGTSKTGSATIKRLKAMGITDIVAGTRNVERSKEKLKEYGASEVIHFDTDESSVEKAFKVVDCIFICIGGIINHDEVYECIERLASQEGSKVNGIVAIGGIMTGMSQDQINEFGPAKSFQKAMKTILSSKIPSVIVAPCWFMENWLVPQDFSMIKSGKVLGNSGDGKVAYIAVDDIAAVCAEVLVNLEKYNKQTLDITGPESFTEAEITKRIGKAAGNTDVKYQNVSEDQFQQFWKQFQFPPELCHFLWEFEIMKRKGHAALLTPVVKQVTGREPKSLDTWLSENTDRLKV